MIQKYDKIKNTKIASQLKRMLASKDLSHRKLSKIFNYSASSINTQLSGKTQLKPQLLNNLVNILNVEVNFETGIITKKY